MGRTTDKMDQGSRAHEHGTYQDYYPQGGDVETESNSRLELDIGHLADFHQEPNRPKFDGGISGPVKPADKQKTSDVDK